MKLSLLLLVAALTVLAVPARAALNLAVDPLVIEMRATPGQSVKTVVNVVNAGDQPERIVLAPMDWTTRADGSIAIEKLGREKRSITQFLTTPAYQFILQPGERRATEITLTLPSNFSSAAASYWGGFFIRATLLTGRLSAFGPGATVVVYVDVGNPHRSVDLQSLKATVAGSTVHIIGRVRNNSNAYIRAGGTLLFEQSGRIEKNVPATIGAIFPGRFHTINETVRGIPPGKYRVELSIDYGGNEIEDGETTVTVP